MDAIVQLTKQSQKFWKLKPFDIHSQKYSVRLAQDLEEVEAALRLRFEVFNMELGEGLSSSFESEKDEDAFDSQCDHLLVIENETDEVIGTYRLQDNEMAVSGKGFYTYTEFNIHEFKEGVLSDAVELGRACVQRNHRNGRVLYLLWRGIAKYLQYSGKRFLFGCCSLTSQDPEEGRDVYQYLIKHNHMHAGNRVSVQAGYECNPESTGARVPIQVELPVLFRLYLDIGAKVCSHPAFDPDFKTIDFLILLDINNLAEQTKTLFFR